MSEIFDFLKKTEAERKKNAIRSMPGVSSLPFAESALPAPTVMATVPKAEPGLSGLISSEISFRPAPKKEELLPAETFDLSQATYQLQNALDPMTIFGEQFRVLRTKLMLLQKQNGMRTILMTSTVPQEGKSFTSCALGGVIAQEQGKRVVIIDADMRKNGSGRDFGINGNNGVIGTAQVLQGIVEFQKSLMKSVKPEFWFLPSGSLPTNPSELLSSPNLERMIKYAASNFDFVIVDAPPVMSLSDPSLIAPLCDAVVLVVRANSTSSKLVMETINRIGRERICGMVLNRKKQIHTSQYYYQYYYRK